MLPKFLLVTLVTLLTPAKGDDLLTVASNQGCFKLVGLIRSAGLEAALKAAPQATLFAPTDVAIAKLPQAALDALTKNATLLAEVLKFHVVPQVLLSANIRDNLVVPTLSALGPELRLNVYQTRAGAEADNGFLFPVMHPTHRTVVTAEGAVVSATDFKADNGLVHVLDDVMFPLPTQSLTLTAAFDAQLSSLTYLLYEAKLTQTLAEGAYTVFAPTTAAFNKLPGQFYNDILMNLTMLHDLLLTHVVKGVTFSAGLSDGQILTNVQGTKLQVGTGNGVHVNGTNVIRPNVAATNGVIHVIDKVIIPQDLQDKVHA